MPQPKKTNGKRGDGTWQQDTRLKFSPQHCTCQGDVLIPSFSLINLKGRKKKTDASRMRKEHRKTHFSQSTCLCVVEISCFFCTDGDSCFREPWAGMLGPGAPRSHLIKMGIDVFAWCLLRFPPGCCSDVCLCLSRAGIVETLRKCA